jgi:predicted amidophosphoribosyltransferase
MELEMPFPIKICAICKEEFELKPDKPGFANRCPQCTEEESNSAEPSNPATKGRMTADERKTAKEANDARRQAMRNLLYRKDG